MVKSKRKDNPGFGRILVVVTRQKNLEPVLFEFFFLNRGIYEFFAGVDIRKTSEDIKKTSLQMLGKPANEGGYALGSGSSNPDYVPI